MSATVIQFPDGETITTSNLPVGVVPPDASPATVQTIVNLNYLMRPPLADEEIELMPVKEVISLYYSIYQINGCQVVPNAMISAGLGPLGVQHERHLRQRIYSLRTDLLTVNDGKNSYRVLIDPSLLEPPPCSPGGIVGFLTSSGMLGHYAAFGTVILGAIFTGGALGALVQAAQHAAAAYENLGGTTLQSGVQSANLRNKVVQVQNLNDEVTAGIKLAEATVPDPVPDATKVARLLSLYQSWQNSIPNAQKIAASANAQIVHANDAIHKIAEAVGVGAFISRWTPYTKFFLSDTVEKMVFPEGSPAGASATAAVGIGLAALLLALL